MADNAATVAGIYEAFGSGDIPSILEKLHPDVEWDVHDHGHGVPWLKGRKGKGDVAGFFESLQGFDFHQFDVKNVLVGGDQVVALVALRATWKETGKTLDEDSEVHVWTFDDEGLVTSMRHVVDTKMHVDVAGL